MKTFKLPSTQTNKKSPKQCREAQGRFCLSYEFLLFVDQQDCLFIQEAELRPTILYDAIKACDDTTTQIIRMDHDTWSGEDVTEDIATAWLDEHEPELSDENKLPIFVQESDAWQHYEADYSLRFGAHKFG